VYFNARMTVRAFAALGLATAVLSCSSDEKAVPAAGDAGGKGANDSSVVANQSGTLIDIRDGKVQGDTDGNTRRFRGIPFAKPPLGALRWKPPQPVEPWTDVRDVLDYGSQCAQPRWIQGEEVVNEDCLYLNVWTPGSAPGASLPVMVWLPGGGNQNGGASDTSVLSGGALIYDGRDLSESGNVVVVTINYRVGAFGFFSHPGLTAEGSNSGNQGLLDQRAALAWVRDNIAAFGGDPKNVTLFGESAGAQDTCLQVVSPGTKGLFHRAMSQSGGCTTRRKTKEEAERQVTAFAEAVGCGSTTEQLACLRDVSTKGLLLEAPVDGLPEGGAPPGGSQFSGGVARWDFNPVVDGTVIPDQPRALVERGEFAKVPYVLGSNFEEGKLFLLTATPVSGVAEYTAALDRLFGSAGASVAAAYPPSAFPTPQDALVRIWGDFRLGCSTYDSARRFAKQGSTVYMFHFSRGIPGLEALLGATHGVEMPYVFGTLSNPPSEDASLSDDMQGYWTRFAKAGDPNGGSALQWPKFDETGDESMGFDVPTATLVGFRRTECDFWATIYDAAFP
jgi:para-nitrobenzyl esterase